jgi:hypothetical protein
MQTEKSHESKVRRLASEHGYSIHKSRERKDVPHIDNHGEYMLVDVRRNFVVLGVRFNASLDQIEAYLSS